MILAHEGRGEMTGFVLDREHPSKSAAMNGYDVEISLDEIFGTHAEKGLA